MKTILLMTDFSENAKNAIKYAINMFGEEVEYLLLNTYVVRENTGSFISISDQIKEISEKEIEKEILFIREAFLNYTHLKITAILLRGDAIDGVNEVKDKYAIDLVVMGTKGASGLSKFLVGSVTASVVQCTGLPVLIIPEKQKYKAYTKIVLASDFTLKIKKELLNPLQYIAQKFNAEVTLLNVQLNNQSENQQEIDLSGLLKNIKTNSLTIDAKEESVCNDIEKYCKKAEIEMLTVVAHHNTFFERLFHKSVSQELIYHAQLPILALDDSFTH